MYYDPLLAKLIVHGRNREEAISRMSRALAEFIIDGVQTTIPFLRMVMKNWRFISGELSTHFIEEEYAKLVGEERSEAMFGDDHLDNQLVAAIAAMLVAHHTERRVPVSSVSNPVSRVSHWKIQGRRQMMR